MNQSCQNAFDYCATWRDNFVSRVYYPARRPGLLKMPGKPHSKGTNELMYSHFALILAMLTAVAWTGALVYLVNRWDHHRK